MSGTFTFSSEFFSDDSILNLAFTDDPFDRFRMLKYALFFCGIIPKGGSPEEIVNALQLFGDGDCLKISLVNKGPSRSGFASSSAVATVLLQALYNASGQFQIARNPTLLGSMVLLFENELGLKSGRQDVDGLLPGGFKILTYPIQAGFLVPVVSLWEKNARVYSEFSKHLILIDTGIPRAPVLDMHRGLNMRHWAFLSRDHAKYTAIVRSISLHHLIVKAFHACAWETVALYFSEYMALRAIIDPGAIRSIYDEEFKSPLLLYLFSSLKEVGLIYGGMFTGAMGGGVAMLICTAKSREKDVDGVTLLDASLSALRRLTLPSGKIPFAHLNRIFFDVNFEGSQYTCMDTYN